MNPAQGSGRHAGGVQASWRRARLTTPPHGRKQNITNPDKSVEKKAKKTAA